MNIDITHVENLPDLETLQLRELIEVWNQKRGRNELRQRYYDAHNRLKDLGISIPPPLQNVETVVGWPAKAVDTLAARSRFDGFTTKEGDTALIDELVEGNRLKLQYHEAVTSELISSCSFLTVTKGGAGEPAAVVNAYSAMDGAALWSYRRKRIECGLVVVDVQRNRNAEPTVTWVNLFTDSAVWEIRRDGSVWTAEEHRHTMGRPLMEPLVYRPTLNRPFGKSRISRAVMSITDSAVRCALRTEVSSEFYTAPQKYILGAEDTIFSEKSKWEQYIGNWLAITKDEDGDIPHVGQFSQMTMQPHTDYMRSLAARLAGETSVPVSMLGIIHDNPASADAIAAEREPLVIEAESLNDTNGYALTVIGKMALAIATDTDIKSLPANMAGIMPSFRNPSMPSIVTQADAMVKIGSQDQGFVGTDVYYEQMGFNEETRKRIAEQKEANGNRAALMGLMGA